MPLRLVLGSFRPAGWGPVPVTVRAGGEVVLRTDVETTPGDYVTLDDPSTWSRPWTLMIPLKKTGEGIFEFACHEGNYGLAAILRGARAQESGQ